MTKNGTRKKTPKKSIKPIKATKRSQKNATTIRESTKVQKTATKKDHEKRTKVYKKRNEIKKATRSDLVKSGQVRSTKKSTKSEK